MDKTILVVDHHGESLQAIQDALQEFHVVTAQDGESAIRLLEERHPYDLCLLNVNMLAMSGFELYDAIRCREAYKTLPVIFLTEQEDAEVEKRCLELGASDFIKKPFIPGVIRLRVLRILELEDLRRQLSVRLEQKVREVTAIMDQSTRDPLTGLRNRIYTEGVVDERLRTGATGTLMMIDLDNFKAVNDLYGHQAGDQALRDLADVLHKHFREDDILCRIGGDEFVVFVNGLTVRSEIRQRAAAIIGDMDRIIKKRGYEAHSSVSIGIAQTPEDARDFDTLYLCADKALYHVKQTGKHNYYFYGDQKEEERKRATNSVDIRQIEEMFERLDAGHGAYLLDYGTFPVVYNFIRRFVERNGRDVQFVLFTVMSKEPDRTPLTEEMEQVLEILDNAIYTSLRRVDASTRYSSRQVIVLLMDTNSENGEMVAERVVECFTQMYQGEDYYLVHDIARMPATVES